MQKGKMLNKILPLFLLLLTSRNNAQESPAFYVPNWTPGVSHRHNFCEQHAAVERGQVELRNALQGLDLTVGFFTYQLDEETGTINAETPDIAFDFFDELARRGGFNFRNNFGVLDPPMKNETWSDILFYATDVYDVIGEYFDKTTKRVGRNILYPEGWYNANYILVTKTDENAESDLFSFAAPLTPGVWGLIALTSVVSGLVYYLLDYLDSRMKKRSMDMGLESSLFLTAFLFKGHCAHNPKSRGTRILVFSMAFFFLLIVACYTANLASFLVLKNRRDVVNDIQDAIRTDLTFCVERGTATDEYLQTFGIQPKHLVRTVSDDSDMGSPFLALQEGKCDIAFTEKATFNRLKISEQYNPNCNLEFVGRIQKFVSAGFALKDSEQYCASLVRDVLNLHMMEMKDSGVYDMIWDNRLSKKTTNSCEMTNDNDGEDDFGSLGIANLSGVFALHAIALAAAVAITFSQFCRQPGHRKTAMISEIAKGLFDGASLNRAVIDANNNPSTTFSIGKNNQTSVDAVLTSRASEMPTNSMTTTEESPEEGTTQFGNVQKRIEASVGRIDLAETKEENKKEFTAVVEQNQEQQVIIKMLLKQLHKTDEMNESVQKINESVQRLNERVQKIEETIETCVDKKAHSEFYDACSTSDESFLRSC